MNITELNNDDISIIMKQLDISESDATMLLSNNQGNLINAIANYIEPTHSYNKKHYNTTYHQSSDKLNIITELRTIVTDKENILKNITDKK